MKGRIKYECITKNDVMPSIHALLLMVSFDRYDTVYRKTWLYVNSRIIRRVTVRVENNLRRGR